MRSGDTAAAIDRAAAAWVVRHAAGLAADEAAVFEQWRRADPRHAGSFVRASAIVELARFDVAKSSHVVADIPGFRTRSPMARRAFLGGGAAAVAAAVALPFVAGRRGLVGSALGEQRSVPLPDGSTALLNTASRIRVRYAAGERRIELLAGEAWFDVAPDPARPFLVDAGTLTARAVGTAFSIRRLPDGGERMTVTEGVVRAWRTGHEGDALSLAAGHGIELRGAEIRPVRDEREASLAWRAGMIELDGETLGEAAADFNRYNPTKLVVVGEALARQRVYGTFHARDPLAFAKATCLSLDARQDAVGDTISIRR